MRGSCACSARLGAMLLAARRRRVAHVPCPSVQCDCALERHAGSPAEDAGTAGAAVLDGRTLILDDGREVFFGLARHREQPKDRKTRQSRAARLWFGGRAVVLKRLARDTDRHGRLPAYVFAPATSNRCSTICSRPATPCVAARVGDFACAAGLLAAERGGPQRRARALGGSIRRRRAAPLIRLPILAQRGRLTLVEGRVVSVRESGGTIYVNFGRRWSEDFTATLLRRNEEAVRRGRA